MKKGIVSLEAQGSPSTCRRTRLLGVFRKHKFLLAAFLIPLAIRAIPEILVGPYPVGWDTIAFYVPNTIDWAAGKVALSQMLGTPLLYIISVPLYFFSKVNPVWTFKIIGPVLYGAMIWSLFRFLRLSLRWPGKEAFGAALLTSLYFVTLRMSWDMYRVMFGITFILLSLPLLGQWKNVWNQAALSGLLFLAVASDQLTGVITISLVGTRAFIGLKNKNNSTFFTLMKAATPSIVLFFLIVYDGVFANGGSLVQAQPLIPTSDTLVSSAGFLVYAYLPLLPLSVLGFTSIKWVDLRTWAFLCLAAALTALLPFLGLMVLSYRWAILLDVPLCVFAFAGLSRLQKANIPRLRWPGLVQSLVLPLGFLLLVSSASLYIALPAQQAFPYYATFPGLLPSSMLQDTVPQSDMQNLRNLLSWVAVNMSPSTALITHQAIYGWAKAYLPPDTPIVKYGYSSPLTGVEIARSAGYSQVFMIWWVNAIRWDGQSNVPSYFHETLCSGNMCVYETRTSLSS